MRLGTVRGLLVVEVILFHTMFHTLALSPWLRAKSITTVWTCMKVYEHTIWNSLKRSMKHGLKHGTHGMKHDGRV